MVSAGSGGLTKAKCLLGRHAWVQHSNPEVGGKQALYETCSRCGKERQQHEPPSARAAGSLGL